MNVLSLFDGMSCGQIALKKLGIQVDNYFASEIDKHAIAVTMHNFPNTIQLGDVTKVSAKDLPKIDLLVGGSPCQGFSFAGKQLAFDDPRSVLFFEFVRLWHEVKERNPNAKFMLENVRMKKEHELIISKYMNVEPIAINSNLVSAQNRYRLYWTNIKNEPYGLFGDMRCTIPQPEDKGILLRDVLESEVDEKYFLSEKMLKYFGNRSASFNNGKVNIRKDTDKASTLTASMSSCDISDNFICCIDTNGRTDLYKTGIIPASYSQEPDNYSSRPFIVASRGRNPENPKIGCIKFGRTEEAKKIRKENMAKGIDYTPHAKKEIVGIDFYKMNTLTTAIAKDNLVITHSTQPRQGRGKEGKGHLFKVDQKSYCLDTGNSQAIQMLEPRTDGKTNCLTSVQKDNLVSSSSSIRRLTPLECERLQTVPIGYTATASDTQRYKMLGNGWTVDVIAHIFSFLNH